MTSNIKSYLNLLAVLVLFCSTLLGQDNERFTQGVVNDSATVSLGVPLGNYSGRGVDLPVSLNYSSSVWRVDHLAKMYDAPNARWHNVTEAIFSEHAAAGWKSSLDLPRVEFPKPDERYNFLGRTGVCNRWRIARMTIYMPDGTTYQLRKSDVPHELGYVDKTGTFYAVDGSRVRYDSTDEDTGTLYMPDGMRYVLDGGSGQIIDRHGNTLTYNGATRAWTDTIGREIVNPLPVTPSVGEDEYTLPGLAGVNDGEQTYVFKWEELEDALTDPEGELGYMATRYLAGSFPPPQAGGDYLFHDAFGYDMDESQPHPSITVVVGRGEAYGVRFNPVVLTEITLPDNSKYKFSYNAYGEIDKVVYPTSAFELYEYESPEANTDELVAANQPYVQASRRVKTRGVSENGTGSDLLEWEYAFNFYGGVTTVTAPDDTKTETYKFVSYPSLNQNFGFEEDTSGKVYQRKVYSGNDVLLRRELNEFEETASPFNVTAQSSCQGQSSISGTAYRNARVKKSASLIFESGSSSALSQMTTFSYDATYSSTTGVDQTAVQTYHYTVLGNEEAEEDSIEEISVGSLAKTIETAYSTNSTYRETKHILGVPIVVKVKNSAGTVVSQSEMLYDESGYVPSGTTNAVATSMKTWYDTGAITGSSPYLITHATFDAYGNRTIATDAKGYSTTTTYDSTHHAFPISVTSPIPNINPNDIRGSTGAFTSSTSYDVTTGLVLATTDPNGETTEFEYEDYLLRPTKVTAPNGHQTITEYGAGTGTDTRWVKVKTQIDADHWREAKSFYDGLGRTYKVQKNDLSDPLGDILTITCFDNMGRVEKSSNPFRNITNPNCSSYLEWTTPEYDDLNRTKKVTSPNSDDVEITYGLSTSGVIGSTKIVTDQAGKKRLGITDALGNMIRVVEDPDSQNLATDYIFDALGNLRKTTQGDQTRYFMYDSLGRVLFAKQPEQLSNSGFSATDPVTGNTAWSMKYEYDDNGNIEKTTDARGIYIEGIYDRFDRLTQRDYSDSTPDVSFYYDGSGLDGVPSHSKGKTTKVTSSVSENRDISFDLMGRVTASRQITDGQSYNFEYVYNLSGVLIEETYPSTRKVKFTLNQDGEMSQVQSRKNSNAGYWVYVDALTHDATGAVTKMQLGNGHWETASYNDRQQVTMIGLGSTNTTQNLLRLEFKYNTTSQADNNGSMREQKIIVPAVGSNATFTATQSYTYDSLNRLEIAAETVSGSESWKQKFTYDRYGNRRFDAVNTTTLGTCSTDVCNPNIGTADNRLSSSQGYVYDEAGSLTEDAAGQRFTYSAGGEQTEFFSASNQTTTPDATYHYDGEGKRVKKTAGSEVTVFVYDSAGQLAAKYSTTVTPVNDAKVSYLTTDSLGSPRVITDQNGSIISRKDFTAFGEEVTSSHRVDGPTGNGYNEPNITHDYTGYQKDGESGLEFAQARYYNVRHGRFTSTDPLIASATIRNPQTFNRYSYVLNSPYKFTDPLGLMSQGPASSSGVCSAEYGECSSDIFDPFLAQKELQTRKNGPKKKPGRKKKTTGTRKVTAKTKTAQAGGGKQKKSDNLSQAARDAIDKGIASIGVGAQMTGYMTDGSTYSVEVTESSKAVATVTEGAAEIYDQAILYGQAFQVTENNNGVSPTGVNLAQMEADLIFLVATQTEKTAQALTKIEVTVVENGLVLAKNAVPYRASLNIEGARHRAGRIFRSIRDIGIKEGKKMVPSP